MIRKGYALTLTLCIFILVLSITFSGVFNIAAPRIQMADENTKKLEAMLNEIIDALNTLWIADASDGSIDMFPSNMTLTGEQFEDLVERDIYFSSIVENLELQFSNVFDVDGSLSGVDVWVTCEIYKNMEIYPYKINIPKITIEGNEIKMLVQYRKRKEMIL